MTTTLNASTVNGFVTTADTSGNLALQGNGTTVATAQPTGFTINSYAPSASLITQGTAIASTSGTAISFTGIPSWVKRITVMFRGTSTSGTSPYIVQIGSGSYTTSGYLGSGLTTGNLNTLSSSLYTAGFAVLNTVTAASIFHGIITIVNQTGNSWVAAATGSYSDGAGCTSGSGSITLSGVLDRVQVTTVNGTDTFDAGSINILYE